MAQLVDGQPLSRADLQDPDTMSGKAVIIAASQVPVGQVGDDAYQQNMAMIAALLRAMPEYVCYLSSEAVYPFDVPVTERTDTPAETPYARMHLDREQALKAEFSDRLLILRVSQVYGPNDRHNAYGPMRMLRQALTDQVIHLFGKGEERRHHISVHDAARAIAALVAARRTGVLNLSSPNALTFLDVARHVADLVPSRIEHLDRRQPITHRDIDISALRAALPNLTFTGIEAGLRDTLKRMQSHG